MTSEKLGKKTACYLVLLHISVTLAGPVRSPLTPELNYTGTSQLEGVIFRETNNAIPPHLLTEAPRTNRTSAVTPVPVDLPLFYPSSLSHQPGKNYGLPRETYHPLPIRRNKDSFRRPAGFTPVKPSFLGFPPITNTRDNVGLEINWAAKVGRAHRSFYDFLLA